MEIDGFIPNLQDENYIEKLKASFKQKISFIERENGKDSKMNKLPYETIAIMAEMHDSI